MANLDFPGICLSCVDEKCNVEAADLSAVHERITELVPEEGYTRAIIKNLMTSFPDKFKDEAEAYLVYDVFKAIVAMGLKNLDAVDLRGLGELRSEPEDGKKKIIFTPERVLLDMVNE